MKLGRTFNLVRKIQFACGIFWENSTRARTLPKSFKHSALSVPERGVIESPSTPLNLSTFSLSGNEIGSSSLTLTNDSKKRKERDFSSAPIVYELRSRKDSIGAGNLDADMKKLMEAREKARVKAANARRAAKSRAKALTEKKVVVVEKKKRRRNEKEEEEVEAEGEEEHEDEGEEEDDETEGEEEHSDEGEVGVEGGEGAGRDEAEEMAGVGDDSEANIVEDSNDIEETESAFAASFYQEREYLKNSHIAIDDEEDWEETAPFEPVLPNLDNPQAVLEWIYAELKDVCLTNVILMALQSIMRGGEDAEDSNIVVSLCEDDQEDFYSNPASADGNRVPAEEVENVVMESEEERTEGALQPKSCFLSIEDAEDSNIVVSLCEDDQEDSHSKANPASADGKSC
jgi:hypothetical protein